MIEGSYSVRTAILEREDPSPWQFAANAFPVLIAPVGLFWLLRILARAFFQQLHLWSDSAERVVMIKTYLSLLTGQGVLGGKPGVEPEHIALILSQIFRHGKQGILPEDAAPPVPWSPLTKDKEG